MKKELRGSMRKLILLNLIQTKWRITNASSSFRGCAPSPYPPVAQTIRVVEKVGNPAITLPACGADHEIGVKNRGRVLVQEYRKKDIHCFGGPGFMGVLFYLLYHLKKSYF